jgi:hypothetical protein
MRGLPQIRWSLNDIIYEFRIDRRTLLRRLEETKIQAEPDGTYSSPQVRELFEGGMAALRRAKVQAETRVLDLKAGVIERNYLKRRDLEIALAAEYNGIRRIIERSKLSQADKRQLLLMLGKSPDAMLRENTSPGRRTSAVEPQRERPKRRTVNANGRGKLHPEHS